MKTLLIIDDLPTMREIIARTINMTGLEFEDIMEAGDGIDALELLKEIDVDIIICDIVMPGMDGIDFVKELRKTNEDAYVILISTEDNYRDEESLKETGANAFLTKPFTPDSINDILTPIMD